MNEEHINKPVHVESCHQDVPKDVIKSVGGISMIYPDLPESPGDAEFFIEEGKSFMQSPIGWVCVECGGLRVTVPDGAWKPHVCGGEAHPDDDAVDRFATALKDKLAAARLKGRGGWEDKAQVTRSTLTCMLMEHLLKGDPLDVANFCMFLHLRGEKIDQDVVDPPQNLWIDNP